MPALVAHRGVAARFPENTLAALDAAAAAGARHVEVDVQMTRDRVPVLFHDTDLRRLCDAPGTIHALPSARLAALRVRRPGRSRGRDGGAPIPTLERFVRWLASHPAVHAFVEVKSASVAAFGAASVLRLTDPLLRRVEGRVTRISSSFEYLEAARARDARRPLGVILRDWAQRAAPRTRRLDPAVLFVRHDRLPPGRIPPDPRLAVYEVGTPALARALARRGVAYVETFDVARMIAALGGADFL